MKTPPFSHIYLDLDGVIFDYYGHVKNISSDVSFRKRVVELKIFEKLELLDGAIELIELLKKYENTFPEVQIKFLTSCGMYDEEVALSAQLQKTHCLNKHDIFKWPALFTNCGESKAMYAKPGRLLIDDTENNICNFRWNEGQGFTWCSQVYDRCLSELHYNLFGYEYLPFRPGPIRERETTL